MNLKCADCGRSKSRSFTCIFQHYSPPPPPPSPPPLSPPPDSQDVSVLPEEELALPNREVRFQLSPLTLLLEPSLPVLSRRALRFCARFINR